MTPLLDASSPPAMTSATTASLLCGVATARPAVVDIGRAELPVERATAARVVGRGGLPETQQVCELLHRRGIPYEVLEPDVDGGAQRLIRRAGVIAADLPIVVVSGIVLRRATPRRLVNLLDLGWERP